MDITTLKAWYDIAWPFVHGALIGALVLTLGWIASKWAHRLVIEAGARGKLDQALARFFGQIARYVVLAATLISALGALGVQTTSLLTVFASAGLAVGLALQGSLSNFASGVMILFFRPFNLNDAVRVAGEPGQVVDIGLFATTIVNAGNETVIIPNGAIIAGNIVNFTRQGTRRAGIAIGVAYGTPVPPVMRALDRAVRRAEGVLPEPPPDVALVGFGASSVDFEVRAWGPADGALFRQMQHNVRVAIYEELAADGIEIPFPQIVVHGAKVGA